MAVYPAHTAPKGVAPQAPYIWRDSHWPLIRGRMGAEPVARQIGRVPGRLADVSRQGQVCERSSPRGLRAHGHGCRDPDRSGRSAPVLVRRRLAWVWTNTRFMTMNSTSSR